MLSRTPETPISLNEVRAQVMRAIDQIKLEKCDPDERIDRLMKWIEGYAAGEVLEHDRAKWEGREDRDRFLKVKEEASLDLYLFLTKSTYKKQTR